MINVGLAQARPNKDKISVILLVLIYLLLSYVGTQEKVACKPLGK